MLIQILFKLQYLILLDKVQNNNSPEEPGLKFENEKKWFQSIFKNRDWVDL